MNCKNKGYICTFFITQQHAHVHSSSDESYDLEDSYDPDTESVQSYAESLHANADVELELRPKWAQTTL